jgi:hypothetical protein
VRVEREDARARLSLQQHVDENAFLLLEGARERDRRQALECRVEHVPRGEGLDVGFADELLGAPLHRRERYHL